MRQNLTALVEQAVHKLGRCSMREVLAEVGRFITPATALLAARRRARHQQRYGWYKETRNTAELTTVGKSQLVLDVFRRLCKSGRIARLARGVYGPPPRSCTFRARPANQQPLPGRNG